MSIVYHPAAARAGVGAAANDGGPDGPPEPGRGYVETLRESVGWLWQTDAELTLTYVSHALPETSESPGESWVGRSLLGLVEREAGEATPTPLLTALRERRAFRDCALEWARPGGERLLLHLTGVPFHDPETGEFAGYRGTGTAAVEAAGDGETARALLELLKTALSERNELRERLAESDAESVRERLSGIAHELRTPLNAVIGFAELIRDRAFGDDPARYAEYGGVIHRSGVQLLQLVNRILDSAELESGLPDVERRPFAVPDLAREVAASLRDTAAAAGVEVAVEAEDRLPAVLADRQMARQILFHALSRALARGPAGRFAGIAASRADDGAVAVTVWEGPAPSAAPAVPAPDEAAEGGIAAPEDLGPAVLAHLAETMGGRLEVAGIPGEGSRTVLHLPTAGEDLPTKA